MMIIIVTMIKIIQITGNRNTEGMAMESDSNTSCSWALGMIKKKTENHIKRIPENPCLQELQKILLNGTAHLLQSVLSM